MCGIFGIVKKKQEIIGPVLTEAGRSLSYRGYDSVGCATMADEGTIDLRKDAGKVDEVAEKYSFSEMVGRRGIMQLRWATFGAPSLVNSQPHLDSDGDLVGAHNGNVVNNAELREEFMAEGMVVRSTNDGESCVHAVERFVDQGFDMVTSIRKSYDVLEGDYAYVIGSIHEDCLHTLKKGSGLVIGIGEDFTCVSSDLPSVLPLTRKVLRIYDGELATLWHDRVELRDVQKGDLIDREPEIIEESMEAAKKGGFPHFMLKEIYEQPDVAVELLHRLENSFEVDAIIQEFRDARNIYFVGCGTSYHACLLGSVYFNRIAGRVAIPVLAPQFSPQFGSSLNREDAAFFVSQSGETKDVLNAIAVAEERNVKILGLANVVGSTLTRVSSHHLPLTCGYEISVPATKTFTNQVITFLFLAYRLAGKDTSEIEKLPGLMRETIDMVENVMDDLVPLINQWDDLYCLGYGLTYPVALEGALKLKEITYAHCEGMLSTEFKHGPLSAIRDGFPVLFVAGSEDVPLIVSGINEITCRGGYAITFGQPDSRLNTNAQSVIEIPVANADFSALLTVLPLQILSYKLSIDRGYDPDFPRNLSKTLTVD